MDAFTVIARGDAPALSASWAAMYEILSDQMWHTSDELVHAVCKRIPLSTARNLIADAALTGRVEVQGTGRDVLYRITPGPRNPRAHRAVIPHPRHPAPADSGDRATT